MNTGERISIKVNSRNQLRGVVTGSKKSRQADQIEAVELSSSQARLSGLAVAK